MLRPAIAVVATTKGADSNRLAFAHYHVATALRELGRRDESRAELERAHAVIRSASAPGASITTFMHLEEGAAREHEGDLDAAERAFLEARRVAEAHPSMRSSIPPAVLGLARVSCARGRTAEGLRLVEEARVLVKATGNPRRPSVPTVLGTCLLAAGRAAEASRTLEEAVALHEAAPSPPRTLARARFALARALAAERRDPPRARLLAEQARAAMVHPAVAKERAEIDAFLAARR